ncbi:CoA transferase [Roseomonas eburnea]|uniref:CoA transferase n=1 Tax=Neoroseomonas eburnea TaxID=1346889 RepID=A0A9X9XEM3_9PROT|nr:CoA transferase [Neoroseomonas eburnea]MBR0682159.1 CoA transferase [Neoroseomonas eburnea]
MSAPAPLAGLRVVELGQVLAGPFVGAILADLGAEVVKVEKPGGDDSRGMGPAFRRGDSLTFHEMNRGKASVVLDLRKPGGRARLHELLAPADILVHNLRPGAAEALGIGAAETLARHPRLIYCAISAFGRKGPLALRPGYEPLLQAFAGLCMVSGEEGAPPQRIGASVVDYGTAMWTVIGALSALRRREATGRGGVVDTSLFETALVWTGQRLTSWLNEGRLLPRTATGHPNMVPYQAFQAADAPLIVCCGNDRLFVAFAAVLGRPDWAEDARFATNRRRLENREALLGEIAAVLATRSRAAWLERLERAGVPCGPINTIPEVAREPQTEAVGLLLPVPGEDYRLLGLPVSFDGERPAIRAAAPALPGAAPDRAAGMGGTKT